jgi:signal transduction histidine kinase
MSAKISALIEAMDRPSQSRREALVEQILWLIRLRWIAAVCIVGAALIGSYVFPVLASVAPTLACAGILVFSNVVYLGAATKNPAEAGRKDTVLATIQIEVDLVVLTAVLHFSGGAVNPFFMLYVFHVVIATIMLPRNLSFAVGLTAVLLFALLAINELQGGALLGYHPLGFSSLGGLWRNPHYVLGVFVAFVITVMVVQYMTRIVIVRMTAKELEASQNRDVLRAVINAMAEGLVFVTGDGRVAICNPTAALWKKSAATTEQGASLDDLPPAVVEHVRSLLDGDDKTGGGAAKEIKFTIDGPQRGYIEARSCPVIGIDNTRLGYVIVGEDLTAHKKLEGELIEQAEQVTAINEMLKMSRVEMAQREKMVAIGQMATGIAHEIGNPLASLSSAAQYLARKLSTHEQKEYLLVIEYHVNRISKILKHMLSLARPATSEYKWTNVNEIVDNTFSLIRFDKRMQSVRAKNIGGADLPMVWLNPQLLEQVLLNIFINALDAMGAKQNEQEHVLEVTTELKDELIEIRASDTGIGMSPEVCRRAFESFFTTKEVGKGTGLGLFISYNLISEVDGTITMESEPDKGTTVIIRIPVRPKKDLISTGENQADYTI